MAQLGRGMKIYGELLLLPRDMMIRRRDIAPALKTAREWAGDSASKMPPDSQLLPAARLNE